MGKKYDKPVVIILVNIIEITNTIVHIHVSIALHMPGILIGEIVPENNIAFIAKWEKTKRKAMVAPTKERNEFFYIEI
ncbi:MAG: hypothetical protein IPH88_16790 [Bacteroidales bacterium]|nr:hypothetical protein [Bacteroidales bacterium]